MLLVIAMAKFSKNKYITTFKTTFPEKFDFKLTRVYCDNNDLRA